MHHSWLTESFLAEYAAVGINLGGIIINKRIEAYEYVDDITVTGRPLRN